jgi:hypothetical protein
MPDSAWPALPLDSWTDTRETLHRWTQIAGKIRMARTPLINHWWNTTLYVSARGLTTSLMPAGADQGFELVFDFLDHRFVIETTAGARRTVALRRRSVADFYAEVTTHLADLGLTTPIWTMPVEIPGATTPFDQDTEHASYEPAAAHAVWRLLVSSARVMTEFRAQFLGKCSPVHFFWGGFDLAVTRFSGRAAPPHPGGAPNCGPHVMLEAYSHEVSSAGYWPGGGGDGLFYSYAYPVPGDFSSAAPDVAYSDELGEFVLPYTDVRTAADPDATLLAFLQRTYEAAAERADWDRANLER